MDRCVQAVIKNSLEPEWEARFEATSYGFRPGRSAHDALSRIYNTLSVKTKGRNPKSWILDADIEGFFDNVCHEDILEHLKHFPANDLIERWLKAGAMTPQGHQTALQGTPQGGILSPLLANIALSNMDNLLQCAPNKQGKVTGHRVYVRYANDFVVMCPSKREARRTTHQIIQWLKTKNLRLAPHKTRIVHADEGFDFLGVNIRRYKTTSHTQSHNKVLRMQPSKKAVKDLRQKLRQQWRKLRGQNVQTVIRTLNPIVLGWRNYHRPYASKKTFSNLDDWMYKKSWRYALRTHGNKGRKWIAKQYYGKLNKDREDKWVFGCQQTGQWLEKFAWANIMRHTLVKSYDSPFDPTLKNDWKKRRRKNFKINNGASRDKMAAKQSFICPVCEKELHGEDELATHHIVPQRLAKIDTYWNPVLVHQECHRILHANPKLEAPIGVKFLPEPERKMTGNTPEV